MSGGGWGFVQMGHGQGPVFEGGDLGWAPKQRQTRLKALPSHNLFAILDNSDSYCLTSSSRDVK